MKSRLHNLLFNNLGLKILAVIFSILVWFFVVSVNDPEQTQTFTAAVKVIHAEVLDETGEYYTVVDGKTTVTFQATAKRSILEKLTSSDFSATADMNFLDRENSRIPVDITVTRYASQVNLSTRARYLNVKIGEKTDTRFVIEGQTSGTPADGFAVDEVTVSPNVIRVQGPAATVKKIQTVTATVDVDGMSQDTTEAVVPKFFDADGKEVDVSGLKLNAPTVQVTADISSVKAVAIKVETSGDLPEGYELNEITTDPSTVTLVGDSSILNDVTEITVPSSVVDLSKIAGDFETTVDITSYLPNGVHLLNSEDGKVVIRVDVVGTQEKTITVPTANITLTNVQDGMTASFVDETISVTVKGLETDLSDLSAEAITGSVDCSGFGDGVHKANVTLNLKDGVEAEPASAEVKLEKTQTDTGTDTESNT